MKSILDPSFTYVNSSNTDLRKTFARVRGQQRAGEYRLPRPARAHAAVVSLDTRRKSATG